MPLTRFIILALLTCALACASPAPGPTAVSRSEFRSLCRAMGAEGGKLSREQFLAQSKDKAAAAQLFDACDTENKGYLTEEDVKPDYIDSLKGQAMRLTEPGGLHR